VRCVAGVMDYLTTNFVGYCREKARPKFRLGAACETLICGSCKAIVNEFAFAVHAAVNSTEFRYIEQVSFRAV